MHRSGGWQQSLSFWLDFQVSMGLKISPSAFSHGGGFKDYTYDTTMPHDVDTEFSRDASCNKKILEDFLKFRASQHTSREHSVHHMAYRVIYLIMPLFTSRVNGLSIVVQ